MRANKEKWSLLAFILLMNALGFPLLAQNRLLKPENLKVNPQDHRPKLFDIDHPGKEDKSSPKILPNRVYAIFVPEEEGWFFTLTTAHSSFTIPLELFRAETVVPATSLGSKRNPYQRFKLTEEGKWITTKEEEKYSLWLFSNPPTVKEISFIYP